MENIRNLFPKYERNIIGKIVDNHIILDIVGDDVHYWSPRLNFRVEIDEEKEDHSIIAGLIGPRPAVWTMFMFIYFSVGILGFFISSFGVSKLLLGEYSHYLLAFPIAIAFMFTAYSVGKYGERLAKDQMDLFREFIREVLSMESE